jgi:hypothetical protein
LRVTSVRFASSSDGPRLHFPLWQFARVGSFWHGLLITCDQSVNNSLPNTPKQHHPVRAKPTKNQQDTESALRYEPGGRRFESCRARQELIRGASPPRTP